MTDPDTTLETLRRIDSSAVFMQIYHPSMQDLADDPSPAFQLGAAILLDKPIVVLRAPGRAVPAQLLRIADEVVDFDMDADPAGSAAGVRAAIEAAAENHARATG